MGKFREALAELKKTKGEAFSLTDVIESIVDYVDKIDTPIVVNNSIVGVEKS